jgi:adenylate cyclase
MKTAPLAIRSAFRRLELLVGLAVTMLVLAMAWQEPAVLVRLENLLLDVHFKVRGERPAGQDIVLVVVDDKSLAELGRWPWSRVTQARIVDAIAGDDPKVIGIDVVYAEPEPGQSQSALGEAIQRLRGRTAMAPSIVEAIRREAQEATPDETFAHSVQAARNVVLPYPFILSRTISDASPLEPDILRHSQYAFVKRASSGGAFQPYTARDVIVPLEPLALAAAGLGHVYNIPDLDGVSRYEYLAIRYQDGYYPSFAVEAARLYLDVPKSRVALLVGDGVRLGDRMIPADQHARMLINYLGREGSFPSVSATDVVHRRVPRGTFANKLVLLGTSALATYSQRLTPFSANVPSVEQHATIAENILTQQFVTRPLWTRPLEFVLIALFGVGLAWSLSKVAALTGALAAAVVLASYAVSAHGVFVRFGMWLPLLTPTLTIALVFTAVTVINHFTKERQAKQIRSMFSRYVSPRIVDALIKDPGRARLGGTRKELTVLFADIVGFSTFSEKRPAEEVVAQLNEYLTAMTEVVFQWHGTLDKFIGDGLVVFWNAPIDQPNHTEIAIKCALHMRKRLAELREKWEGQGKTALDNGIGINTGVAVVGNIGAEKKKMDYTVIGDQVNLAARLQGLTRTFACPIIVSGNTAEQLKKLMADEDGGDNAGRLGHVLLKRLGTVSVKGRNEPVVAYSVQSLQRGEPSIIEEASPESPQDGE